MLHVVTGDLPHKQMLMLEDVGIFTLHLPRKPLRMDQSVKNEYSLCPFQRFTGYKDEISKPQYIGKGEQGFVFRFEHKGRDLCMKLFFKYEHVERVHENTAHMLSPFGSECRAFARLCDLHENGNWAVQYHGWMFLNDRQLHQLRKVSGRQKRNPHWEYIRWAVVKDFITEKPPTSMDVERLQDIASTFNIPKRGNILPRDVKRENYGGQRMVDLGCTLTYPFFRRYASEFERNGFFQCLENHGLTMWD
ncbi:hypothetical protein P170DRAFT_447593 [Aspergillus steynii IBT 23096]|uniref:Uncharacterized protein n=1 Tax=Aspergillus steynii IBT 23096 TaxID=1392250 RepID=A0A2I2G477_9EURO|nr:uncharacterized protein P170DRAFT_447593 [Aspergillus steynii IBT 23096]PLB47663.1 hypothetical protein P170DRAFT_447593 [Aspergillus steynii IBT 23096]